MDNVEVWGVPPPRKDKGKPSKYTDLLEEVRLKYQSGEHSHWGLVATFASKGTASSTGTYLRPKFPDFEFRTSENPDGSETWVVWARWKGST